MFNRITSLFLISLTLFLSSPSLTLAQGTTGTIRGRVNDETTGDPLAAVSVFVLETDGTATTMGSSTNAEGDYVIINVPPGMYMLRATMVGYVTVEVEELMVTVGVSTSQSFQLESTVLDVGEVVTVTHQREMIQRDVAATQQSFTFEEMERMAVSSTQEILQLQTNTLTMTDNFRDDIPGYYDRGLEQVHMRGGRNAEVAFMIDGMQVTNLVFGGQAANVSPFSLSEMVVMAGGMSAEFGNAMSGVVNMVTREGGRQYDANMEVMSSEFSGAEQDDVRDESAGQGYLGGPVPLLNKMTFFLSGSASTGRDYLVLKDDITFDPFVNPTDDATRRPDINYYNMPDDWADFNSSANNPYLQRDSVTDNNWRIHPFDVSAGWMGYGFRNEWSGMGNLTYKLTPTMKMTISGSLNGQSRVPYTNTWRYSMFWGLPREMEDNCVWGTERWDADAIDPVTGNPIYSNQTTRIVPGTGEINYHNEKNIVQLKNQRLAVIWTHQLGQSTFYSLRGSYYDYNRSMRVKRWINAEGWSPRFEHLYPSGSAPEDTLWHPDDQMTQITLLPMGYSEGNDQARRYGYAPITAAGGFGFGANMGSDRYYSHEYDITRTLKFDITNQATTHHQLKLGILYNSLTIDYSDLQLVYYSPPYDDIYVRSPWEMGVYFQDKVEYDFIILNLGVRYDASNAGKIGFWVDPRDPMHPAYPDSLVKYPYDTESAPIRTGQVRSQYSPRIGISHPVTERSVIYFNYGHFYQNPIYRNIYIQGELGVPRESFFGNPNLQSEKTVAYEFGYKHQFTELFALELALWAKDTSNMTSSEFVPEYFAGADNPYYYWVVMNYDYAVTRGIDLALIKRYSNFWRARLNYSFMTTQSNRDDPWAGMRADHTLETMPKRPVVLGWDQPHRISAELSLSIPEGAGFSLLGIRPFERFTASFVYRVAAGKPYTPSTKGGNLERNSGRRPWTYRLDAKLYRDFEILGLRYSLFIDIDNVFDRKNTRSVWSRTGKADDPGPGAIRYSDYYDRSWYYDTPRTISLGLRIYF